MSLRIPLVGSALALAALGGLGARALAKVGNHRGYQPAQPIAFSHRVHAGEARVPCLYCHAGATRSRHAGIPAAAACMNCHGLLAKETAEIAKLKEAVEQGRPIVWSKVHNLPDFVHFDHSRHVTANVRCEECHGKVEAMDEVRQHASLSMGWCLDCHRERAAPAGSPLPKGPTGEPAMTGMDCGRCHH